MDENTNKVAVKILKHTGAYNPGEVAGFSPAIAEKLIASGMAVGGTVDEAGNFKEGVVPAAAARSEVNDTVTKTAIPIGEGGRTVDADLGPVTTNASSQKGPRKAKAAAVAAGEPVPPEATSAATPVNLGQGEEGAGEGEADGEGEGDAGAGERLDPSSVDIPDGWEHLPAAQRKQIASKLAGHDVDTVAEAAPIIRAEVDRREKQA